MTEGGPNHWQIVSSSLTGRRAVDEQTRASVAVLDERLNRLRKLDKIFAHVEFSPDVKNLKDRKNAVPVG